MKSPIFTVPERKTLGGLLIGLVFSMAAIAPFGPAFGDVMDVGSDGTVTVHNSPSVIDVDGFHPIEQFQMKPQRPSIPSSLPAPVSAMISYAATRYNISSNFLQRVAWQESRFRFDAVSPKGAVGIMQLMDGTARELGVNRYDSSQNILGGAAYLRQMLDRFGGNRGLALAAYNAGPGAVDRYRGIPPFAETQSYVKAIIGGGLPSAAPLPPSVIFVDP